MVVLGIESTAHTASVGIVGEGAKVLGLATDFYQPPAGGIHPREAANHHVEILPSLVGKALEAAGVRPSEIDAVAFAQGPGLGPCLRAGATVARMLSLAWNKPLVPVNHCVAHVEIARVLSGLDDPLLLYASGGNTQVIAYARGRYRVLGETLDIGVGNFLDKLWIGLGGELAAQVDLDRVGVAGTLGELGLKGGEHFDRTAKAERPGDGARDAVGADDEPGAHLLGRPVRTAQADGEPVPGLPVERIEPGGGPNLGTGPDGPVGEVDVEAGAVDHERPRGLRPKGDRLE